MTFTFYHKNYSKIERNSQCTKISPKSLILQRCERSELHFDNIYMSFNASLHKYSLSNTVFSIQVNIFENETFFAIFKHHETSQEKEMQFSPPFTSNTAAIIMIWCLAILLLFAGHFLSFECILTPLLLLLPFWVPRGFHPQFIFPSLAFPDRLSMRWEITLSHFFMCLHICNC